LKSINDNGYTQIDSTYRNLRLLSEGTATLSYHYYPAEDWINDPNFEWINNYGYWTPVISLPTGTRIVAFRPDSRATSMILKGSASGLSSVVFYEKYPDSEGRPSKTLDWRAYG